MPQKIIHVDGLGEIPFYKRRGTTNIKVRISGSDVRVTLPLWVPYKAAVVYVSQRASWISENRKPVATLEDGSKIGKNIVLRLKTSSASRYSSKYQDNQLVIKVPEDQPITSSSVQNRIKKYVVNALQNEAEELLLPLIRSKAAEGNFIVNKIEVKNLKSRWGSCTSHKDLAFSLFLVQLPWHCIEYVIYHELAHTVHMNHSKDFWTLVERFAPNYRVTRREMKQYSPHIVLKPL